jgi:nucleoside-diphosphate-sugar epimerase|tara:strand:+ start:8753 stop:9595 length:843 start_codon:yes stop_codon:yes gene_type:complete
MKYLVLGSAGQIGNCLCNYLQLKGHEVLRFDIVDNEFQDLRIHDNKILEDLVNKSDFIYFLAFDVGGSRYLAKYQHTFNFLHNNIRLMSNTFELIKKYKKKFIFASSQMSNMSHSPYGVAKAIGERYTDSLEGLTVKFWNVYGPEKDLEKSHVITDFILKAKDTGKIEMLSDGTEQRQFLHADDCSDCLLELSQCYDELDKSREYHITNFKWNSILDVANIVANNVLLETEFDDIDIIPGKSKDLVQLDKRNEADEYILNFWTPKIDLEKGIQMIIKEMS